MTPPATAAAAAPALALASAAETDDDPLVAEIDEYWAAINKLRVENDKRAAAQFYTQAAAASLLASTAVPAPRPDGPVPGRIIDWSCGAGMLPLFAVRETIRLYPQLDPCSVVENTWIADLDLGALTVARRVISKIAPPAVPRTFWHDALFGWAWQLGKVEVDPLDIAAVDERNAHFARRRADWVLEGHSVHIKERGGPDSDPVEPFGTVHVYADRPMAFHWDPEAAERYGITIGTYHPPMPRVPAAAGTKGRQKEAPPA